jgi:hypothetical protein
LNNGIICNTPITQEAGEVKVTRLDGSVYYQKALFFENIPRSDLCFNRYYGVKKEIQKESREKRIMSNKPTGRPRDPCACSKTTLWRRARERKGK